MKIKNFLLVVAFILAAIMQPLLSKSQSINHPSGEVEKQNKGWQPVKLGDKGTNVQNGVEFYSQQGVCNSEKVTLTKLINTNNYAVKIAYQVSPESPVVTVSIAALATVEGSCAATEANLSKLIIKLPEIESAKQKSKQHLLSHIVVSRN